MAKKSVKLNLTKVLFQARYAPEIEFLPRLAPTAALLKEYPEWHTTGAQFLLRDPEKRCSLNIAHELFHYDQDAADQELEAARLGRAMEILPGGLGIKSYTRLGYRRKYLVPLEMSFESCIKILNVKLLSQGYGLRKVLPPRMNDLMFRVDMGRERYLYHITVGPVQKHELTKYLEFSREHLPSANADVTFREILAGHPELAILIDIDYYLDVAPLNLDELKPFVTSARAEVHRLASELAAYLLDESAHERE